MSTITAFLPLRVARRALGLLERVRRPSSEPASPAEATQGPRPPMASPWDDADSASTRELLVPTSGDEPPATRASRQAQDYLERRRRKLSQQLDER